MSNDEPRDVWLSGTENIHLVQELLESSDENPENRQTGRTNRLACKYALMALTTPNHRVLVTDHYESTTANLGLIHKVRNILDVLKIDYEVGTLNNYVKDPHSFTGMSYVSDQPYIIAKPKERKKP